MSATLEGPAAIAPPRARDEHAALSDLREFGSLLLSDWLESWRGVFPSHGLKQQWLCIAALSLIPT